MLPKETWIWDSPRKVSRKAIIVVALLVVCGTAAAAGRSHPELRRNAELKRAAKAVSALQRWYDPGSGLYRTTGWWNSANAITVLADYARASGDRQYDSVLSGTFSAAQKQNPSFLNHFYDDEGWWALAWIDAYDLTKEPKYLSMAESIFADMSGAWDSTCGGGIWWNKDRNYKNAIANELFLSVAAHLANRVTARRSEYLDWANREWKWFAQTGMINARNLVNDGLGSKDGKTSAGACQNNGQTIWTYNQGVVIGGLVELSKADAAPAMMQTAGEIAHAAMTRLVDGNGILHETCEPNCGADGGQFKGIFVRNLAAFAKAAPNAESFRFIDNNARSIWKHDRGLGCHLGLNWAGPFAGATAATQSSALDALVQAGWFRTERKKSRSGKEERVNRAEK